MKRNQIGTLALVWTCCIQAGNGEEPDWHVDTGMDRKTRLGMARSQVDNMTLDEH